MVTEQYGQMELPGLHRGRRKVVRHDLSEHEEQSRLFEVIRAHEKRYPLLQYVFAIPNGGHRHRAVAVAMWKEGIRKGVPDIFVAQPKGRCHGLWIEMKTRDGKASPDQSRWLCHLDAEGYCAKICRSWEEAWQAICDYLDLPDDLIPV